MRRSNRIRQKVQDRISELPDDILVLIISKLPLQEALATSILSTRWRYLCTYITHLNFPPIFQLNNSKTKKKNMKKMEIPWDEDIAATRLSSYVNMVDGTLDSHRGNRVEELRLNAYSMNGASASLDKWLVFALTKQAQVIEINTTELVRLCTSFGCSSSLGLKSLIRMNPTGLSLECLKQLRLCGVGVSDEDLAILVSTCVALETLIIRESYDLMNVSIVGHSSLKHLDISSIFVLQSFEIRNVANLVSLKCYLEDGCALRLENVPKLTVFGSGEYHLGMSLWELFSEMPSCVRDQLQLLHLSTIIFKDAPNIVHPLEFANTKRLELEVVDLRDQPFYLPEILSRFIAACPCLQKLQIKLSWRSPPTRRRSFERKPNEKFTLYPKLSPILKELEIIGYIYSGSESVLQLASYIIQYAGALEELIVAPFNSCDLKYRDCAQHDFRSITPDTINLKII